MLFNSLVRSRLTYECHACYPTCSEMAKLMAEYNLFLRSMFKNAFERMNPVGPREDHS